MEFHLSCTSSSSLEGFYTTPFRPPLWHFPSLPLSSHMSFPVYSVSYILFRNASSIHYFTDVASIHILFSIS
jgi:hypothetical protein